MAAKCHFALPPFCHFTPEEWQTKDTKMEDIINRGSGAVLLGEVSQCNDDNTDNRFYEKVGRFPAIEEDEPPYRLLCDEYPPAK